MNRYEKGQIYKIVDVGYNKCYIGSTCEGLKKRFERHRNCYKAHKNGRPNSFMSSFHLFDEFGVESCKIEWIKDFACNSKKELEAEEGRIQQQTDCVNKNVAGRTVQQYREDNKERISANAKIYRTENYKDLKQKRQENAEYIHQKGKEHYQANKEYYNQKHKEHYYKNKEATNERHQKNYWANRDKVLANMAQKINCGCGSVCRKGDKAKHERTKKHQDWLMQQEQE